MLPYWLGFCLYQSVLLPSGSHDMVRPKLFSAAGNRKINTDLNNKCTLKGLKHVFSNCNVMFHVCLHVYFLVYFL